MNIAGALSIRLILRLEVLSEHSAILREAQSVRFSLDEQEE